MELLKYINPVYLLNQITLMIKDLNNYIYYNKQVNRFKKANTANFYNIKIDKLNRIYTAVNLPPEILLVGDNQKLDKQEREIVGAKLGQVERVLQDYNIYELVRYKYQRVKTDSHYAYKIRIVYKTHNLNILMLVWIALYVYYAVDFIRMVPWHDFHGWLISFF